MATALTPAGVRTTAKLVDVPRSKKGRSASPVVQKIAASAVERRVQSED